MGSVPCGFESHPLLHGFFVLVVAYDKDLCCFFEFSGQSIEVDYSKAVFCREHGVVSWPSHVNMNS